jgi:hypothetical protein
LVLRVPEVLPTSSVQLVGVAETEKAAVVALAG